VSDADLLEHFEAGREPPGGFHHREHVQAAWAILRREPLPAAIDRFRGALRRYAKAQGASRIYHETVTVAFLLLIHERMARGRVTASFARFAAKNPDLFAGRPSVLEAYYQPATLKSPLARRVFLMPDRLAATPSADRTGRGTSKASPR
jgi:hypothetical protein